MGANLKVIQIETLMVVAEEARLQLQKHRVGVLVDARMSEVYAGAYAWQPESNDWTSVMPLQVGPPEMMLKALKSLSMACDAWAGNGFDVYKDRLDMTANMTPDVPAVCASAMPHALALLRLAPAQWARGQALAPENVQPLYIREKVAQTTAEREAIKASKIIV
jgi:tRNA threonylcarbamoyladenosine biosynthesis protein TsaB